MKINAMTLKKEAPYIGFGALLLFALLVAPVVSKPVGDFVGRVRDMIHKEGA